MIHLLIFLFKVYVYHVPPDTTTKFWRDDGLQWRFLRTVVVPTGSPVLSKSYFQLIAGGEQVDFKRIEFTKIGNINIHINNSTMCRYSVNISIIFRQGCTTDSRGSKWPCPFVVVHYIGSFVVDKIGIPAPHGNWKATPDKAPSKIIRELLDLKTPPKEGSESG